MSIRRRLLSMLALATLGLLIALGVRPASADTIVSAYVVALAALGLLALTRAGRAAAVRTPSIFEYALKPRAEARVRPPELIRIEREITLGSASAAHLHRRLLPLLRESAATRLLARHHVDLARQPDAARSLLGDAAWDVLRPDRPEPVNRNAPGLSLRQIARLVQRLEQL